MLPIGSMLTENHIVDMVSLKLDELNFEILSRSYTNVRGMDIIARKDNQRILIEAKGGTTSKQSKNKGKPFDRSQAKTHISAAIFNVLQLKENNEDAILGLALPYEKNHYEFIESIKTSLIELKVIIFWCDKESVKIENSNLSDKFKY